MSNLLVADQRSAIKEIFGDLITSFDRKIPRYEAAEKQYEEAKDKLREEVKRIRAGLEKYDAADTQSRREKIAAKLAQVAREDIGNALGDFIERFLDLIKEYGE